MLVMVLEVREGVQSLVSEYGNRRTRVPNTRRKGLARGWLGRGKGGGRKALLNIVPKFEIYGIDGFDTRYFVPYRMVFYYMISKS